MFENVVWSRHARGVIRCGISNIRFSNIEIVREAEDWCLSSSGGGPQVKLQRKLLKLVHFTQIGQPGDGPIYNVTVENLTAENTGDDSIAFFNVAGGGVINNCTIKDSFARGILLRNSQMTSLINNTLVRCHVLYETVNTKIVQSMMMHIFNTFLLKILNI